MKQSPLQLKWVSYPAASYEHLDGYSPSEEDAVSLVKIKSDITWDTDGDHMASLSLESEESEANVPYRFAVSVAAVFSFDIDVATKAYNPASAIELPSIISVNVARLLYSGAREHLAMMTARGPYGPAQLQSVLIEPSDLNISSTVKPSQILREIFRVPEDVVADIEKRAEEYKDSEEEAREKGPG